MRIWTIDLQSWRSWRPSSWRPRAMAGAMALGILLAGLGAGAAMTAPAPAFAAEGDLIQPTLGDDGLYHHAFFLQSFLDLGEDLADSQAEGKRLVVVFEQRGCIYCKKVNTEVLADPAINAYVRENFNVLQLNLFGDRTVTDLDGEEMTEKELARRWGILFTPTFVFLTDDLEAAQGATGKNASVFNMQGAFGKGTFTAAFEWVKQKGYEGDMHFQKFVAERVAARQAAAENAGQ